MATLMHRFPKRHLNPCLCLQQSSSALSFVFLQYEGCSKSKVHKDNVTQHGTTEIQLHADIVTLFFYVVTTPVEALVPVGNQCIEVMQRNSGQAPVTRS
jgi:hypothetical protein